MRKFIGKKQFAKVEWANSYGFRKLFTVLSKNQGNVFCVGGCVRDLILGHNTNRAEVDIDIATDVTPDKVKNLLQESGFKVLSSAIEYGTITAIIDGQSFQITTFRSDVKSDGRRAKVRFSKSLKKDAERRDFTMNALYMNMEGEVCDPLSGWEDLISGNVRFIGDPEVRIKEDYLRILRYFRFVSLYDKSGKSLDQRALSACAAAKLKLKHISKERIWMECKKILSSQEPLNAIRAMEITGVLAEIFPKSDVQNLEKFLQFEKKFGFTINEIYRLLALNSKNLANWKNIIQLTKKDWKLVNVSLTAAEDTAGFRVKGYKYGYNSSAAALAIFDDNQLKNIKKKDLDEILYGSKKKFPLNSDDFLKIFEPSKSYGQELKKIKSIWFGSNLELERADLLALLKY